jgi:Derlin-2/3
MFFLVKYSKSLEEGSFRNRPADFLWMLLVGAGVLVAAAPWVNIQFLGSSLTFMMVGAGAGGVCGLGGWGGWRGPVV